MKGHARERYVTDLSDRIGVLTAQINALNVELAAVVGAFDEETGWGGGGFRSMSHWLGVRAGWSTSDASRIARVGARLDLIPTLAAAADRGEVSLSMLDAAARVTTPENEEAIADVVRMCTPSQAGRVLGSYRKVKGQPSAGDCMGPEPEDGENVPLTEQDFWWREWVDSRGRGRIDAAIHPETLERLKLARAAHECSSDPETPADGEPRPSRSTPSEAFGRVADAAIELAEQAGKRDVAGERFTIQITADLATVAAALGIELDSKFPVGLGRQAFIAGRNGQVRKLSDAELAEAVCNANLQLLIHEAGVPLWLGNETRNATRHQRRALKRRCSQMCEFPGCTSTRYLEPHHVAFHSEGGKTSLDNLVMLCWTHHHELHQGTFEIRPSGHQVFGFYGTFGACMGSNSVHGPPPDVRQVHHGLKRPQSLRDRAREPARDADGPPRSEDLSKPECESPDRHLRLVDPTIPRPTGGGERLTYYGLDVLVTKLLLAS